MPRMPSFLVAQPLDPKRALSEQMLSLANDPNPYQGRGGSLAQAQNEAFYAVPRLFDYTLPNVLKVSGLAILSMLSMWAAGGFR